MLDEQGDFVKRSDAGVTQELWDEMTAYAREKDLKGGNYKKLNLPFENRLLGMPPEVRKRMAGAVEDFVYSLLTDVFNAQDTAPLAIQAILDADSYDLGPKCERLEDPSEWTEEKIRERAASLSKDKGSEGDYDD